MAVIPCNANLLFTDKRLISWSGFGDGDTFTAFEAPAGMMLAGAVQISGTFDGATVALQVSLDGVTYTTVSDVTGQAVSFTAAGLREFSTAALFLRPSLSGAGGSTALTLTVRLPLIRAE